MSSPLMIQGPAGYDPVLGEMRTNNFSNGSGSGAAVPGYRMNDSGGMLNQDRYFPIENVTGSTVTLQAGHAYSINATSGGITLNCEVFSASRFGLEGHLQIFTANAGYIHAGANVYLKEALEPNSINNCLVRFHGGSATISVEDHLGGYIVISGGTATGSGSLPYGLASAASPYIAFSDLPELTGVPITMGGVVTNGEKHIAGNSYADTILTGGVTCTSKTTFANLTMSGVVNSGGTMTLTDVHIPNNATVAVSGGTINVESAVLDGTLSLASGSLKNATLRGSGAVVGSFSDANVFRFENLTASGITFSGQRGKSNDGWGVYVCNTPATNLYLDGCTFSGNMATDINTAGVLWLRNSGSRTVKNCTFKDNLFIDSSVYPIVGLSVLSGASVTLDGCNFVNNKVWVDGGTIGLTGTNTFGNTVSGSVSGTVTISSGAVVDLTGNSNAAPIAPGGGITFASGGATVLVDSGGSGANSSYMMNNVTLPAGAKLTNTNAVNLGGTHIIVPPNTLASISGCSFVSGSANGESGRGGAICVYGGGTIVDVTVSGNSGTHGGGIACFSGSNLLSSSVVSGNSAQYGKDVRIDSSTLTALDCVLGGVMTGQNGKLVLSGSNTLDSVQPRSSTLVGSVTISSGASINLTSSIAPGGGIQVVGGTCTVNGNVIPAGTYTSIDSNGQPT